MKIKNYLFLLLTLMFSINLSAVTTTGTIDKTKTENLATVKKKKPVKKFFQNMTQRVLENKIVKRLDKKLAKEKAGKNNKGLLSLIFSLVGIVTMFASSNAFLVIFGLLLGLAGFVLGILGVSRDEKKAMSIIGIVFGSIAVLVFVAVLIALAAL